MELKSQLATTNTLQVFKNELLNRNLLDENNNLNLENCSDEEFLRVFYSLKIANNEKSQHTIRAYKQDINVILQFISENDIKLKEIGFPEVRVFNSYITKRYANRSAVRKLSMFKRILEFGYVTRFYKAPLSPWIEKPSISKGHYSDKKEEGFAAKNRTVFREMSEEEARSLVEHFPKIVRSERFAKEFKARNYLIGMLLLMTGMRASEILNLNWGSFRKNHKGQILVDVNGKGNKQRTIPLFSQVYKALVEYRLSLGEEINFDIDDTSPLFFNLEYFNSYGEKKRLAYTTLFRIVKNAVYAADMKEEISPHWFRHTFITTALAKDVPLIIVKQTAGHSSIATTNYYIEKLQDDSVMDSFLKAGY